MPRRPPIDPHGYYHVSTRGNFGEALYTTYGEHELYLDLYQRAAVKHGWLTLDWALLLNHPHFLVKLTRGGLSEGMRSVNHGFSRRMNAKYGRTGAGHMFRHAFFAKAVTTDEYLRIVCRYIDMNAVEAGRCSRPEQWPWSGCAATLGLAKPRPFHDVAAQLAFFGSTLSEARARYRQFVTLS
jgi:putative transposase